jgi:orotate phosphoribosyltransferase
MDASTLTLQRLKESEALLEGHFLLSSGRHAGRYVQCARLLQYPQHAAEVCAQLAKTICDKTSASSPFDVVVGPAMGAVTFGYELARVLGVRGVFAERAPEGGFTLRRGFSIQPNERVLVAEDVVTTGKSAKEVVVMLQEMGAGSISVASIVNRSGRPDPFGDIPYFALTELEIPSWEADECPLCQAGGEPAIKPGSRPGL